MPGIPSVNVDDQGGARAAAQHLVDLGHRRVAIVNHEPGRGPRGASRAGIGGKHVSHQRQLGWLEPLAAAGIEPVIVEAADWMVDETTGERRNHDDALVLATRDLLQQVDRPTAILCFSDVMAFRVVRTAQELGLRVPEDLSVIGFDDSPLASRMHPALTTVRQDIRTKGQAAAAALTAAIEAARAGTKPPRAKRVLLPTELVVRDSTAPPRGRR